MGVRFAAIVLAICFGWAAAEGYLFNDSLGVSAFSLSNARSSLDGPGDAINLACVDAIEYEAATEDSPFFQNPERYASMVGAAQGTDSFLRCWAQHASGDPYFFPEYIDYVASGLQRTVRPEQAQPLYNGRFGRIRPGGQLVFALVLPEVARGEPFTLSYGDGSVGITLKPLEMF